jgi:ribosomal protein S14
MILDPCSVCGRHHAVYWKRLAKVLRYRWRCRFCNANGSIPEVQK